ncbi:DNA-binding helix-turn-helix protein [Anaerococcus hydrogenalis DSM 7454]|uniref:DNA-binding helix-turn-helix protein n=1 Tax=Anaerococcus hydrogenalis DSM 7454 TaxID=561177 RepID=B6W6X9_9FIRM|nr:helix-turn-helix domain-containing protein [Anaerococcus hydrogenalis]EEB36832.1 DNA-binding helix-turn-helix protein [Anaerococcus hydrogenalis DSM 7454]
MNIDYNKEVGKLIKAYRKLRKLTLEELAKKIYKSKSTLSKYENGQIQIDIDNLYLIADALDIRVDKLLYNDDQILISDESKNVPKFFKNLTEFYSYMYDGRVNKVIRSKLNILSKIDNNKYRIMMYMNYKDEKTYQVCENTYFGFIEHFDAKTNINLTNKDTHMEKAIIQILASFLNSETKWSLWTGFSSRPMMPISTKMLISKKSIEIDRNFENILKISNEDIRLLKLYNMFAVT